MAMLTPKGTSCETTNPAQNTAKIYSIKFPTWWVVRQCSVRYPKDLSNVGNMNSNGRAKL